MKTFADATVITKSDTVYLSKYGYARNGGAAAADICVLPVARANSNTASDGVVIKNVQPGAIVPIKIKKVFSANTTATPIEVYTES